MASDWKAVRAQFPALAEWTYLNSATFGQVPRCAAAAMEAHLARRDRYACADFMQWFDDMDRLRELIGRFIHAEAEGIAFIPNASAALSLLLGGLEWQPGDQIVTLPKEFPNHYYYPEHLGSVGVEFVETPWERFYEALTPRTRVVAISEVNYSTGFRAPLEELGPELRRRGILLYLDGTQSLGALSFDASRVRPDLYAVDAYKWMLSPNGAAFMYVAPELRARLDPSVIGWRSHKDWRNPERLHEGAPEFRTEAEKYEGGMLNFAGLYAMQAVIEMMLEIGVETIERRVLSLAGQVQEVLADKGAQLLPGANIVCGLFPDRDASVIVRELAAQKVLVAARQGYLRVSPHFYNTEDDIARLAEWL